MKIPPSEPNSKSTSDKSEPHKSEIQNDLYVSASLPENVQFEHMSCKSHITYVEIITGDLEHSKCPLQMPNKEIKSLQENYLCYLGLEPTSLALFVVCETLYQMSPKKK